jgi:hypothetical protein
MQFIPRAEGVCPTAGGSASSKLSASSSRPAPPESRAVYAVLRLQTTPAHTSCAGSPIWKSGQN